MNHYARIPKRRKKPRVVHSERTAHLLDHPRVVLRKGSKEREARRAEIFARAGRYCEEIIRCPLPECNVGRRCFHTYRCPNPPTEWSHKRHGANKCDCLKCGIASCSECHKKRHNAGGKPCPKKP